MGRSVACFVGTSRTQPWLAECGPWPAASRFISSESLCRFASECAFRRSSRNPGRPRSRPRPDPRECRVFVRSNGTAPSATSGRLRNAHSANRGACARDPGALGEGRGGRRGGEGTRGKRARAGAIALHRFASVAVPPEAEVAAAKFDATKPPFKAASKQTGLDWCPFALVGQRLTCKKLLAYNSCN